MEFRKKIICAASALTTLGAIGPAAADNLTGPELKALVMSKTIYVSAPFGALPIRYSANGTMSAQSKAMAVFSGGISEDHGTWHISGNQLCQRWKKWNGGTEQCLSIMRTGSTLRWASNDGMSGTAR